MFGSDFKYEEQAVVLKSGLYSITLGKPYEIKVSGYEAIKFPFTVDGMDCQTYPNYFLLQKSSMYDKSEKVKKLYIKELMIRQCFILIEPFDEENYDKCVGKRGKVTVIQDKTGYMHVAYFFPNQNIKPAKK
jgi:hypothetical protein